jgi:hypothetical protein
LPQGALFISDVSPSHPCLLDLYFDDSIYNLLIIPVSKASLDGVEEAKKLKDLLKFDKINYGIRQATFPQA